MNRILAYTTALLLCISVPAMAQYDAKAKKILDAMSAKYKAIPSFKAGLSHTLINEVENMNEEVTGEIVVKGDMYKLNLSGQEIINNGTTIWTYLEEVNEVNITDYDPEEDEIAPSKIYDLYKDGYKYIWLEETSYAGVKYDVVDLVPENKDSQFFKIRMEIKQSDKTLKGWKMYDKTGNIYGYEISDFESDLNVDDSFFTFDLSAHSGVEVIDFR